MNILFRADASKKIGTGHIMRCLTLANELKKQGENTIFCSRHLTEPLEQIIETENHQLIRLKDEDKLHCSVLGDQYSTWLEASQVFDAEEMLNRIDINTIDWIIVDHYALDSHWHHKINDNNKNIKILVINDLFDKSHHCDLFLNQNIVLNRSSAYDNLLDDLVEKLIGPKYALLRDEFSHYRSAVGIRNTGVKNILVFFGGIDINNVTEKTLFALSQVEHENLVVKVVIGATHPKIVELKELCDVLGFELHVQVDNMAELMCWADLSIGASGSASWERSCLGLPALIMTLADNQVAIADAGERAGIMSYLGKDEELTIADITHAISNLCNNPNKLSRMSEACFETTDGDGKQRVIESIRALS
jgi:UDP-2,4-diacetamido-2,4,6-trideoxy-beta-L-altropyranose hydrolase